MFYIYHTPRTGLTGTATATGGSLVDTSNNFANWGVNVAWIVINETAGTQANVSAVVTTTVSGQRLHYHLRSL